MRERPTELLAQHTVVNISQEMPKEYFIWSLLTFMYCNPCCMGLAALISSVKARDMNMVGNMEAARKHGSTARTLNIIATVVGCVAWIIIIVLCVKYIRYPTL